MILFVEFFVADPMLRIHWPYHLHWLKISYAYRSIWILVGQLEKWQLLSRYRSFCLGNWHCWLLCTDEWPNSCSCSRKKPRHISRDMTGQKFNICESKARNQRSSFKTTVLQLLIKGKHLRSCISSHYMFIIIEYLI